MLFEILLNFYQSFGWQMEQVKGQTFMSTTYVGNSGQWVFVVTTDEENKIVVMFARVPESCPQDQIESMAKFLELANFRMTHGAWVIDRSDGEIRFRVGVDMGEMVITNQYISNLTFYTNLTMETYLEAIQAIIAGKASAQDAYEMVFSA